MDSVNFFGRFSGLYDFSAGLAHLISGFSGYSPFKLVALVVSAIFSVGVICLVSWFSAFSGSVLRVLASVVVQHYQKAYKA